MNVEELIKILQTKPKGTRVRLESTITDGDWEGTQTQDIIGVLDGTIMVQDNREYLTEVILYGK